MWLEIERTATERLTDLYRRWQLDERALAAVLAEVDATHDECARDLAYYRMLGEPCGQREQRCAELAAECATLAIELAHVRLALAGVRNELARTPPADVAAGRHSA